MYRGELMRATWTAFIIVVVTLAGATASYTMRVAPFQAPQAPARTAAIPAHATPATAGAIMTDAQLTAVVQKNCAACHSDKGKEAFGNLSLKHYDVATA